MKTQEQLLVELDLFNRHLKHSHTVLSCLQTQDWDNLLVAALSLEASIAALRHWVMHNRMGIDLDASTIN